MSFYSNILVDRWRSEYKHEFVDPNKSKYISHQNFDDEKIIVDDVPSKKNIDPMVTFNNHLKKYSVPFRPGGTVHYTTDNKYSFSRPRRRLQISDLPKVITNITPSLSHEDQVSTDILTSKPTLAYHCSSVSDAKKSHRLHQKNDSILSLRSLFTTPFVICCSCNYIVHLPVLHDKITVSDFVCPHCHCCGVAKLWTDSLTKWNPTPGINDGIIQKNLIGDQKPNTKISVSCSSIPPQPQAFSPYGRKLIMTERSKCDWRSNQEYFKSHPNLITSYLNSSSQSIHYMPTMNITNNSSDTTNCFSFVK